VSTGRPWGGSTLGNLAAFIAVKQIADAV